MVSKRYGSALGFYALLATSIASAESIESAIAKYEKCIASQISKNARRTETANACSNKLEMIIRATPNNMRNEMRTILVEAAANEHLKKINKER